MFRPPLYVQSVSTLQIAAYNAYQWHNIQYASMFLRYSTSREVLMEFDNHCSILTFKLNIPKCLISPLNEYHWAWWRWWWCCCCWCCCCIVCMCCFISYFSRRRFLYILFRTFTSIFLLCLATKDLLIRNCLATTATVSRGQMHCTQTWKTLNSAVTGSRQITLRTCWLLTQRTN